MDKGAPSTKFKRLEAQIIGVLREQSAEDLSMEARGLMAELRRTVADARMDIRDSEYAETATEYEKHAKLARESLKQLDAGILALSQHDIFGPLEVAEFTAKLEQIASEL